MQQDDRNSVPYQPREEFVIRNFHPTNIRSESIVTDELQYLRQLNADLNIRLKQYASSKVREPRMLRSLERPLDVENFLHEWTSYRNEGGIQPLGYFIEHSLFYIIQFKMHLNPQIRSLSEIDNKSLYNFLNKINHASSHVEA
jgi:hypothetical protein